MWALVVETVFEDAVRRGESSIAIGIEMIDEPIYKRALAVTKMVQQ